MLTPTLDRLGIGSTRGGPPLRRRRHPGPGGTPLSAMLPNFEEQFAYFGQVSVPAAYTAVAGSSAWYPLRRIRVPDDVGEEQSLFAVSYELCSPDTEAGGTASAGKTAKAWGNVRGGGAAIVVGVNLPLQPDAWSTAPYFGPGVEVASPGLISTGSQRPYLFHRKFATGKFVDATIGCQRHEGTRSMMPAIFPIRANDSLDVALVVSGATVATAASADGVFVGEALITLHMMRPFVRQEGD